MVWRIIVSFFFFQAEDGIRDVAVTGVQTCALPISRRSSGAGSSRKPGPAGSRSCATARTPTISRAGSTGRGMRSEERRVRERVEISVVAVSLKKKKNDGEDRSQLRRLGGARGGTRE